MRRVLVLAAIALLACAIALNLAACGGSPESPRPKWVGTWTLDKERSAKSVMEYGKAERKRMREMFEASGNGRMGAPPRERDPSEEEMIALARGWLGGMKADVDLRPDGTATADLIFGGVPVKYTGTWSEVGTGAEMKIVSRAEGILQDRDANPIRFTRDAEFLTVGGELDAKGALRPFSEINTAIPFRRMYLSRK